ncbi:hypothetical protein L7F22_040412 [Adiantum nelumboides]|nr:hypothetical protein [Adiantum nelumboides]
MMADSKELPHAHVQFNIQESPAEEAEENFSSAYIKPPSTSRSKQTGISNLKLGAFSSKDVSNFVTSRGRHYPNEPNLDILGSSTSSSGNPSFPLDPSASFDSSIKKAKRKEQGFQKNAILFMVTFLAIFFLFDSWVLYRLRGGQVDEENGSESSGSLQGEWSRFTKGDRPPGVMYGRLLGLAAHALAEGELSTEPLDLWEEPHADAFAWRPCANESGSNSTVSFDNSHYILISANGGLNQQRVAICNGVAVAHLLNATLVLPQFLFSSVWQDTRLHGVEQIERQPLIWNANVEMRVTGSWNRLPMFRLTHSQCAIGLYRFCPTAQYLQQSGLVLIDSAAVLWFPVPAEMIGLNNFSYCISLTADRQSEEANSTVLDLLKCFVSEHKATWERYLPLVEYAYNNIVHTATGKVPFEIVEGGTDKMFEADNQFGDIYQENFFIDYLKDDIKVVKELPIELQSLDLEAIGSIVSDLDVPKEAKPSFFINYILAILLRNRVVHFVGFGNRLSFDPIPFDMQRLRCKCNFHALKFIPKIQRAGGLLVRRMREQDKRWGPEMAQGESSSTLAASQSKGLLVDAESLNFQATGAKYLGLHLRFETDMVAYSMCEFGGGDAEREELEAYREIHFPTLTDYKKDGKLLSASQLREEGKCPLTPEEAVLMLVALGFKRGTRVFLAGAHIYGGQSRMAAVTSLYPNLVTKEDLLSRRELEPFINKSSQLAALDFIGCAAADIFAMTDSGSQLASLVSGYRIYFGGGLLPTIRPNKRRLAGIFTQNMTIEWEEFRDRVRKSVKESKRIQLRPVARSVYRHPRCLECMCRASEKD